MRNLWREENGVFDVMAGADITSTIADAIKLAAEEDRPITFVFNGVTITVRSDSNPELIYRDWSRALSGYIDKNVGPHLNPVLTDEEKVSDAQIEAENERRRRERQREAKEAQRRHDLILEGALAVAPEKMTFRDKEVWEKAVAANTGGYGSGVIRFAECWARLMEGQMAKGAKLEDIAEETSHLADSEGITAFMYGCAVNILSQVWVHGEQLRRWHNIATQIGNEGEKANESGGVLNPALLSIGPQ